MVKSYCVKQKKETECVQLSGYKQAKNGRLMFFCTCAECGITKTKFVKKTGKLNSPFEGAGIMDTLASTGANMLIQHALQWMGKKAVEMGRYYGSEALRNPKLQKKAIDYAISKATPFVQKPGSEMFDKLSTKVSQKEGTKLTEKNLMVVI